MIAPEEVTALYDERRKERGPLLTQWADVTMHANGDVTVPLSELDKNDRATVVNLFPQGLEQLSTRAGSVLPDQKWPAVRTGFDNSENKAEDRLKASRGWWKMNRQNLVIRHRFRFHFAYGCMPVSLQPASLSSLDKREMPHWIVRNPMTTFPAPCDGALNMEPVDCIFASVRTRAWLQNRYPVAFAQLNSGPTHVRRSDDRFTVLEYHDADEIVLVCVGNKNYDGPLYIPDSSSYGTSAVLLERIENKAGIPLVVNPGRITLDRVQGALDQMLPGYRQAAKLNALNELAIARGIFIDQWAVSHPGDPQGVVVEAEADGMKGIIGIVNHGTIIPGGNPTAGAQVANMAIDRLERQQRLAVGLPSQIGGEGATNVRTARQGSDLLGSAIDMPIQEAQEILAASMEAENRRAVAIMKGWFGSKATCFDLPLNGYVNDMTDYTPNETFEVDTNEVIFPMPGVDSAAIPIELGQRMQTGEISMYTSRLLDPLIKDALFEGDQVEIEGVRRALLTSVENAATQGQMGPDQIAALAKLLSGKKHVDLEDAVLEVHKQAQAAQAAQAAAQPAPADPNAQPGIGPGGPPQGGPPSPFSGPPSSPALAQILGGLRQPAAQSGPEQQMPAAS